MRHLNFKSVIELKKHHRKNNICYYKIADQVYQSTKPIEWLEYLGNQTFIVEKSLKKLNFSLDNKLQTIYDDEVLIGERKYSTKVSLSSESTYYFQFDSQKYSVNKDEVSIVSPILDATILMGPVLITNLAINKVFCLHASAFLLKGKAFVLMGDSGTGKSTIAKIMGQQDQCTRVADDILPVTIKDNSVTLLPNFPQLKLPQNCQYSGNKITKETIFLFTKKSIKNTKIQPIGNFLATKKLIKHSVATKLFAKKELQNHFEFCHEACMKTKNFEVLYQHSEKGLSQLIEQLNEIT